MNKKVSIIMGVYNAEKTLCRAINSIVNQTFRDWVFIICDDGSTDKTMRILEGYREKYPDNFLIITNECNKGLTYSLNHCLEYVNSPYVARMDADDISLPKRLEVEVSFLETHPEYAFVGCAIERFDENGVWKQCSSNNEDGYKRFLKSTGYVHPTVIIRKDALDAVHGYRDTWYTRRCEDYDLWMRLFEQGYIGFNLSDILFQYYEGKDSFPKRKYRYRLGECVTRIKGYRSMGVPFLYYFYAAKPLLAGIIPSYFIKKMHAK